MIKIMSAYRSRTDLGRKLFLASLLTISFVLATLLSVPARAGGSVTLDIDHGPVGTGVKAKLTDWPAGALVYAYIDQQSVTAMPTTVPNNSANRNEVTLTFCVPPGLAPGIHPTFFVSTLTGMYSGPIFTITAGTTECKYNVSSCKPAFFIGLRGSGEGSGEPTKPDWLGDTVRAFYNKFKDKYRETNVDVYGVPYLAAMPPSEIPNLLNLNDLQQLYNKLVTFGASVAEGSTELQNVLGGQHAACPDQRFVIVGYSQGAWATGNALATIAQIDTGLLEHIVAVVLLGDPKLWWRQPDFSGIATKFPLVPATALPLMDGGGPRQPSYMPGMINPSQPGTFQFRSYCAGEDPICNATQLIPEELLPGVPDSEDTTKWSAWLTSCIDKLSICQHFQYKDGSLPEEVANWFVERLGQGAK